MTISELIRFCPSYMFMLQFWSVSLERTKIGIGSSAPQSVNPALYLFLTELLFIVMELSNSSIGITTIHPASVSLPPNLRLRLCHYLPQGILPSQQHHPQPTSVLWALGSGGKSPPD